jgi:hypothetical protein
MASVLPTETSSPTRVLYPSTRLVNSNIPLENGLFLKFACREWKNLAADALNPLNGSIANEFAADPDNVYSGMNDLIANIIVPAPKQVQFMSKIKYVDDANFVTGAINAASKVGSAITDLIVGVLASPLVGAASAIGGIARDELTGRRDLDSTNSMFSNAEKRGYNITFTLISTTKEEAREVAKISNMFHALSMPTKFASVSLNLGALYADKAFPPPLWRFGMGTGLGGDIDISWMGQTSFCVLQSVITNTTAAGSSYMVEDPETGAKPMMTSFSLLFVDYEPMYRDGNSYRLIPRSATITNGGIFN